MAISGGCGGGGFVFRHGISGGIMADSLVVVSLLEAASGCVSKSTQLDCLFSVAVAAAAKGFINELKASFWGSILN